MKDESTIGVALVKEACPLCGKVEDGPIILNTRLSVKRAKEVEKLHGQVIGYMDKPCKECQEYMTQGILLIGVIEEKTDDEKNPYRSGNIWVMKKEAFQRIFGSIPEKGAAFLDIKAAKQIGLPFENVG